MTLFLMQIQVPQIIQTNKSASVRM